MNRRTRVPGTDNRLIFSLFVRYGVSVLGAGIALALTLALAPVLTPTIYLFFFAAVVVSAAAGGIGPAVLTAVLGFLAGEYFILPPVYGFAFGPGTMTRVIVFTLIAALAGWLSDRQKRANAALHESYEQLQAQREQLNEKSGQLYAANQDLKVQADELARINRELEEARQEADRRAAEAIGGSRILKALMDYIPEGVTIADAPDVKIRMISRAGQELLGDTVDGLTEEQAAGVWSFYEPNGKTPVALEDRPLVRAVRRGEIIRDRELLFVNAAEQHFWLSTNAAPIRDSRGEIVGGVSAWRDITDRKQAEEARQKGESLLHAITDTTEDAIYVKDRNSRLLMVNPATLRLVGKPVEQIVGHTDAEFYDDPAIGKAILENDRRLMKEGTPQTFEETVETPRGRRVMMSSKVPWRDPEGKVIGLIGISRDITERKRTEEALRKSKDLLARAEQVANMGSWEWDISANRLYWSDQSYELFGTSKEQYHPTVDKFYELIHLDDRDRVKDAVQKSLEGEKYRVEFKITLSDSSVRHLMSQGDVDFDQSGKPARMVGVVMDITELKRAEAETRARQVRLGMALEAADMVTWEWDIPARSVTYSENIGAIFRGAEVEPYCSLDTLMLEVHPEDRERLAQALEQTSEHGAPFECEYRVHMLDGTYRWILGRGKLVVVERGKPVQVLGISMDITERKKAQEIVRQSQERFRVLVAASSEVLYRMSPDWSEMRQLDSLGFLANTESSSSTWLQEYILPEDQPHVIGVINEAIRTKTNFELEHRIRRADGGVGWTFSRAVPLMDANGEVVEWFGSATDITERKRAEEAQRESEDRMRAVISTLPVGVAVMDATGRTVLKNETVERIWGGTVPAPEFPVNIGDTRRYQGWWAGTGVSLAAEDWASSRALLRGETSVGEIIDIQRFDRTRGTILNSATPLRDANGNVNGAVVAVMDITELTRAQKELREADRRKDEFLAMLAHELRNPLAVIANAVHLMGSRELADPLLQKARSAAERQSAHMARMLDDLLDLSRITEGKVTLKQQELALADVIDSAVETARPLIEAAGERLYISTPRETLHMVGDPVRLAQVVGNLLNNAAKYTPSGGEIHLTLERRDSEAAILVRDNGLGIAPELLPHVFDLFVQGERGPDRSQGGLGIGLTMAKRLAEMHGGRIEAASEGPGRGSEFTLILPLAHALSSQAEAALEVQPETAVCRRRVLVVDDNEDAVEMFALVVEGEGHDVMTAHNGAEALALAVSWQPDVVLLDIGMPDIDGHEVARRLKQEPALTHTILIAVTGYGQEEDIQRSRSAGLDHHLVKPVDIERLRRLLTQSGAQPKVPLNASDRENDRPTTVQRKSGYKP